MILESVKKPKYKRKDRRKYLCCQCNVCDTILLIARYANGNFPISFICPSCNAERIVCTHVISPITYKFLRAEYAFKEKLYKKLTSLGR